MTNHTAQTQAFLAVRFFVVSVLVVCASGLLAYALIHSSQRPERVGRLVLPRAFWFTTPVLFAGSLVLHRALWHVRLEKQGPFRRALLWGLLAGTLFVGVQGYGLWYLLQSHTPSDPSTGVHAFVFVLSALHGLHVTVALLFLVFVTVNGFADRYDHEYYWGVTVCTFFWDCLGVVWLAILAVFAIAL